MLLEPAPLWFVVHGQESGESGPNSGGSRFGKLRGTAHRALTNQPFSYLWIPIRYAMQRKQFRVGRACSDTDGRRVVSGTLNSDPAMPSVKSGDRYPSKPPIRSRPLAGGILTDAARSAHGGAGMLHLGERRGREPRRTPGPLYARSPSRGAIVEALAARSSSARRADRAWAECAGVCLFL